MTSVLAVLALLVALAALAMAVVLGRQVSKLAATRAGGPASGGSPRQAEAIEALQRDTADLRGRLTGAQGTDALRHVAVVRYDAFGDLAGRLSFSVALLDDAANGLVFTSIHNRADNRTYAKGISRGTSEHSLSPEELEAIAHASGGRAGRAQGAEEPEVRLLPVRDAGSGPARA